MALKKTLALLALSQALVQYFEAVAEEEDLQQETQPRTQQSTVVEQQAIVDENPKPAEVVEAVVVESSAIEEIAAPNPPADFPTPNVVPELFDIVQPAQMLTAEEIADWERRTDDVLREGNFTRMSDLKNDLLQTGLPHLIQRVEESFTEKNKQQAELLEEDRRETLAKLNTALSNKTFDLVQLIMGEDCARVATRLQRLNRHAAAQLEIITGKTIGELRNEFLSRIGEVNTLLAEAEDQKQSDLNAAITAALAAPAKSKVASKVRSMIGSMRANRQNNNISAVSSQLKELRETPELVAAAIQQLGSQKEYAEFCWTMEASVITRSDKRSA